MAGAIFFNDEANLARSEQTPFWLLQNIVQDIFKENVYFISLKVEVKGSNPGSSIPQQSAINSFCVFSLLKMGDTVSTKAYVSLRLMASCSLAGIF